MLRFRRFYGVAFLLFLFGLGAWGQSSEKTHAVHLPAGFPSLAIGMEYGYAAAFQNRANSREGNIGKGNPFADAFGGINLRVKTGPLIFETGFLYHRIAMTFEVNRFFNEGSTVMRTHSDASVYHEIPLRVGWEFSFGKKKEAYVAPLLGLAYIGSANKDYILGGLSKESSYTGGNLGDSIYGTTEYQFYRLKKNGLAFSFGLQLGYKFKRSILQFQTAFAYNSKDWMYGEIRYRQTDRFGTLDDQGFVYWKTAIWSASLSYRYVLLK